MATAFVLAGGGSLGATGRQVGRAPDAGVHPDFVVGNSEGAANALWTRVPRILAVVVFATAMLGERLTTEWRSRYAQHQPSPTISGTTAVQQKQPVRGSDDGAGGVRPS